MTNINRLATIVAVGLLSTASVVAAQPTEPQMESAKIAFNFTAGQTTFPAGDYVFSMAQDFPNVLRVEGRDHHVSTWISTIGVTERDREDHPPTAASQELLFHKYGDQYFLSVAWIAGHPYRIEPSTLETRAERNATARKVAQELARVPLSTSTSTRSASARR